jgi:pimeloyl-ACP methyl ester carboxylesterase
VLLAEGTLALPSWPDGVYALQIKGPGAEALAPVSVVVSSAYASARAAATHALDNARAAAPRLDEVARTISLPSLEMLVEEADAVWNDLTEPDRDLPFVLRELETARSFAERLTRGDDPYVGLTGIVYKAYRAEADGTLQPYGVRIPKAAAGPDGRLRDTPLPLLVDLHGAWANHRLDMRRVFGRSNRPGESDHEASRNVLPLPETDMLVATVYGRGELFGYEGLGEQDVLRVITDLRRAYPVDPDRIYLTGYSMGGEGTWSIGLRHPSLFAALVPVCATVHGVSFQHRAAASRMLDDAGVQALTSPEALAENAFGLKVVFFHGDQDPTTSVEGSRAMAARFRALGYLGKNVTYHELAGIGHAAWEPAYADGRVFRELAGVQREPFPRRVRFRTYSPRYGENAWVRVDALARGGTAVVDGTQDGKGAFVLTTENVRGLTLRWEDRFLKPGTRISVTLDGVSIFTGAASSPLSFAREGKGGPSSWTRVDTPVSHPVPDHPASGLFAKSLPRGEAHIYVYGTTSSSEMTAASRALAESLADFGDGARFHATVRADIDVRPEDLHDRSIVLVGGARSNRLTARYAAALPLRDDGKVLVAGTTRLEDRDRAYRLVFPRPDAPAHFLLVLGGETVAALTNLRTWLVDDGPSFERPPETNTDYLVLDGRGRAVKVGAFRDDWTIP